MHLLWHGASVYNGHLREPVILTPIAERLALELVLPVFTTQVCQAWDSNTVQSHHRHHVITPLLSHCLTIASSPSHHRVIAPSTKTRSWCDGVIVNYMALSGFHTYLHTSFNYRGGSDNNVTWMKCKLYDSSHLGGYYERRYFVVSLPFYYSFLNFELDVKFLSRNNRILGYIKLFQQKKLSRNYEKRSRNYEKIKS